MHVMLYQSMLIVIPLHSQLLPKIMACRTTGMASSSGCQMCGSQRRPCQMSAAPTTAGRVSRCTSNPCCWHLASQNSWHRQMCRVLLILELVWPVRQLSSVAVCHGWNRRGMVCCAQVAVDISTPPEVFEAVKADLEVFMAENPTEYSGKFLCVANFAGDPLKFTL